MATLPLKGCDVFCCDGHPTPGDFARRNSVDGLLDLLGEREIDVTDFDRRSAV